MKITLRKDWDSLPSGLAKPSPYFSGRAKELAQLKHIILNKVSGSILLGAPRGVGKTDLVYKAISDCLPPKRKDKPVLIPVILNATQLNEVKNTEKLPQAILTNLITRTYAASKGKVSLEIFEAIATLYYQATAKDYQEKTLISDKNEVSLSKTKEYEKLSIGKISFSKKDIEEAIKKAIPVGSLSIGMFLSLIPNLPTWIYIPVYSLLVLFIIVSQSIDFSVEINEETKKTKSKVQSKSIVEQAEILYLRDNSFGNLESGLKSILQDIQNTKKHKIVFVIDELDKIKIENDPAEILDMIQIFKGLFNHSDALFVFIGDFLLFDAAVLSREKRKTSVHSTLFTERIFINRPTIADLKEYLGKIILKSDGQAEELEAYKEYMIYISRMDFFKLPDNIRDYEDSYINENPVIKWDKNSANLQKVNKQKIITALLEDGNYLYVELSNRSNNEDLIETLYETAEKTSPFEIQKVPNDPDPHQKIRLQLEADTANLLYRAGIFERTEISREGGEFFSYTPISSVGKSLTRLSDPLEFEKEFLDKFYSFGAFILRIYNFRAEMLRKKKEKEVNESVLDEVARISGLLKDFYKSKADIYKHLKQNPTKHDLNQETIKTHIEEIDKHCADIVQNNTLLVYKNILEELKLPAWNLLESREILDTQPLLRDYIQNNSISNILLRDESHKNKTVIFLQNPADTIANQKEVFQELRAQKTTYVVELYSTENMPNISKDKGNKFEAVSMRGFDVNASALKKWLQGFPHIRKA